MNNKAPTIESDGWTLISALTCHRANPDSFEIPSKTAREQLQPGDAVKLLFDIETKESGKLIDRGIDRMWVIVKCRMESGYVGVLDNDPGAAENLRLRESDTIIFRPEHVAAIDYPPRAYVLEKYGSDFFD